MPTFQVSNQRQDKITLLCHIQDISNKKLFTRLSKKSDDGRIVTPSHLFLRGKAVLNTNLLGKGNTSETDRGA